MNANIMVLMHLPYRVLLGKVSSVTEIATGQWGKYTRNLATPLAAQRL